jgi:death-on-curing protein
LVVEAIHHTQLVEHGGLRGLRDPRLLESALSRPRHRWTYDPDSDLASLASAYAWGLVKNHPFADGNKRVAFLTAATFLSINGLDFIAPEVEVASTMRRAAAGDIEETDLAAWFRRHARERTDPTPGTEGEPSR